MRRLFSIAALAAIALMAAAAGSSNALAGDGGKDDVFAGRLFRGSIGKLKSYACFVRLYDANHLARHPLQKVSVMKLLVTAEKVPEDEALNYSFRLGLKYRHRRGDFDSSGDCGHADGADAGQFGCGVDCEGGGIDVELTKDNKSVLVKVERIRIWRNNQPDDEASSQELVGGADDRVFRLDRADLDACKSLITDRQELAAMRRK